MWLLINKLSNTTMLRFKTKKLAQQEVVNRRGLCCLLKINPFDIYSIKKEVTYGNTKRGMGKG